MLKLYIYIASVVAFVVCCGSSVVPLKADLTKTTRIRSLPYEDCGSRYDILQLNISSCSSIPCSMIRGSTVFVNAIFDDYGRDTNFLKHTVRWVFNAIRTQATIKPDPCQGQDDCISNQSDGKAYWASVLVNNTLPVMRGTMIWEAGDDKNKNLICFKVPIYITLTDK